MRLDRRRFLELSAGALAGLRLRRASGAESPSLALRVHRETRNTLGGTIGRSLWPAGPTPSRGKQYSGHARLVLPEPVGGSAATLDRVVERFVPAAALGAGALPLETLARLLHLSYGITDRRLRLRAAPSAGALYAGEVYVLASRVHGLGAGVYSYHAPTHSLARLASESPIRAVAAAVEHPGAIEEAPVSVLLTNVFYRYSHRYANRGYRYALIDSGHIGENLRLAAASEGLSVVSPLRFHDDALNGLLAIDGRTEAVCALHAVGMGAPKRASVRQTFVEAQHVPDFPGAGDLREPEAYHVATKLVPGVAREAQAGAQARESPGETRVLPAREPPTATLAWTINERRSAERFLDAGIPLRDLAFLLKVAQGNAAAALAAGVELRLVAHGVGDLEPGVYRYDRVAHGLSQVRSGALRDALLRACGGQDKAGRAAVGFAMLADLEGVRSGQDRRYRDLLLEAGAVAQRLYLAAESIGLAARNLAAFFDDSLNELLRVDGERQAVVHLTMVGPGN